MLKFEIGFEALTYQEALYMVSSILLSIYRDKFHHKMIEDLLDRDALYFNFRRIIFKHLDVNCSPEVLNDILLLLNAHSKKANWYTFFDERGDIIQSSEGYGISKGHIISDKFKISSYDNLIEGLESRGLNYSSDKSAYNEVKCTSKALRYKAAFKDMQVKENLSFSYPTDIWFHTASAIQLAKFEVHFDPADSEIALLCLRKVIKDHHSVQLVEVGKGVAKLILSLASRIDDVSTLNNVRKAWSRTIELRLLNFLSLYRQDFNNFQSKIGSELKTSESDLLNASSLKCILEMMQLKEFSNNLDALNIFSLFDMHIYSVLSHTYPSLKNIILAFLIRDYTRIVEDKRLVPYVCILNHLVFQEPASYAETQAAALFKVLHSSAQIAAKCNMHNIDISKNLKNDPFRIRPLIKSCHSGFNSLDLDVVNMLRCIKCSDQLRVCEYLSNTLLAKINRSIASSIKLDLISLLPKGCRKNFCRINAALIAVEEDLENYTLASNILIRIGKMIKLHDGEFALEMSDKERGLLHLSAEESVAKISELNAALSDYLKENVIFHDVEEVSHHRQLLLFCVQKHLQNIFSKATFLTKVQ